MLRIAPFQPLTSLLHELSHNLENCDQVAIIEESGDRIDYHTLHSNSLRFARVLRELKPHAKNSSREVRGIGVMASVSIGSITSLLGILRSAQCYIPLDEHSPDDRLLKIVDNAELETIVTQTYWAKRHEDLLRDQRVKNIIYLDDGDAPKFQGKNILRFSDVMKTRLLADTSTNWMSQPGDDLAYVLHSSGSTGVPKGIMLSHRNATAFVNWMHHHFAILPSDIVMSRAPLKFDLSVFDIFNTLRAGATLVCFDWTKERPTAEKHEAYTALLAREQATVIYTTPSTFITLLKDAKFGERSQTLRLAMYAGEPFPVADLKLLQNEVPKCRIANIYGPTETNIITHYWVPELSGTEAHIPLGAEVFDTEIRIVTSETQTECAPDQVGEIWCRGATVTLGYLGDSERTAACYVQSPFHKYPAFFWRTGDYGFRDAKGVLHYRGRRDNMVKVNGYRIELGEVETAISQLNEFKQFAVVAFEGSGHGKALACYYSRDAKLAGEPSQWIARLEKMIPKYMMPSMFSRLEEMPMTSSGKIDRVALAAMAKQTISENKKAG